MDAKDPRLTLIQMIKHLTEISSRQPDQDLFVAVDPATHLAIQLQRLQDEARINHVQRMRLATMIKNLSNEKDDE